MNVETNPVLYWLVCRISVHLKKYHGITKTQVNKFEDQAAELCGNGHSFTCHDGSQRTCLELDEFIITGNDEDDNDENESRSGNSDNDGNDNDEDGDDEGEDEDDDVTGMTERE